MRSFSKKQYFYVGIPAMIAIIAGCLLFFSKTKQPVPIQILLAHDKGNLPLFQKSFTRQGEASKAATGIDILAVPSTSPDLYRHQMKACLPTEQAPELFIWWTQYRAKELVDSDLVYDLTSLWDKYSDDYSNEIREALTFNNKVYGFPIVIEYWPVWYNKIVFNQLDLSPPETWTEFIRICETLKGIGIAPILFSLQNDWPAFIWFEEMLIGESPDLYKDLCDGKIRYTDPRVVRACSVWKEMIENDYFTEPSVNMLTNAGYLWNNQMFGMVLCGTWYYSAALIAQGVEEKDIGFFILPSHNPDAGKNIVFEVGPIFTAKNAVKAEAAQKVADWWMSPEGNKHFATAHNSYPGNLNTDIAYLPSVKQNLLKTIQNNTYRLLNRYWEATPTPICEAAVVELGKFILNPDQLIETLTEIDQIAVDYWTTVPVDH